MEFDFRDKSGELRDSAEEEMELCAATPRPQPSDLKAVTTVESFTEKYFVNDFEGKEVAESSVSNQESCTREECSVYNKTEEKWETKEEICTLKTSMVSENIKSFSESLHTSLKLNERVDSSNYSGDLEIGKSIAPEKPSNGNKSMSEAYEKSSTEEGNASLLKETEITKKEATTDDPLAVDQTVSKEPSDYGHQESSVNPKDALADCSAVTYNGIKPADNSLYPTVVVMRESGKDVEAVEFKEIKKEVRIVEPTDSRKSSSGFVAERDIASILEDANAVLSMVAEPQFHSEPSELRVAVVGAGPAGLCAARHLVTRGFRVEVYEQCANIGGTWVYSEESEGHQLSPIHSSLYHDLWTNLPKEAMQFPDYNYPEDGTSYLPSEKILQYLVDYADHHNLNPAIKLKHQVKRIAPVGKGWGVTVEDLSTNKEDVSYFDALMVCSGPNNIPVYPSIEGIAKFSGKQIHSRDYRRAETYSGKRVLIVGLGPSGLDITYQLAKTAKQVILSHNKAKTPDIEFPEDILIKPKVASLFDRTVTFTDGTTEDVDVIIYCTGYTYNFPFMTEDCGITVDQYVGPLYKHLINIERPTMCIVGLPKYCPHQYMVDYQVRAYLSILLGESKIPTKEEMLADLESDTILRNSEGQRKKDYHKLGKGRTKQYMDDLAKLGDLEPVEPVMFSLFHDAFVRAIRDFKSFRNYIYKIVDKENFEVRLMDEKKN